MRSPLVAVVILTLAGCASTAALPPDSVPAEFHDATLITHPDDQPKLVWREDPLQLRKLHLVETAVAADLCVDERGRVVWTRFVSGDPRFFSPVAKAARNWRFDPLLVDGHAKKFILPVDFTLQWTRRPVAAHIDIRLAAAR